MQVLPPTPSLTEFDRSAVVSRMNVRFAVKSMPTLPVRYSVLKLFVLENEVMVSNV